MEVLKWNAKIIVDSKDHRVAPLRASPLPVSSNNVNESITLSPIYANQGSLPKNEVLAGVAITSIAALHL